MPIPTAGGAERREDKWRPVRSGVLLTRSVSQRHSVCGPTSSGRAIGLLAHWRSRDVHGRSLPVCRRSRSLPS